jgi:hypothetical protein
VDDEGLTIRLDGPVLGYVWRLRMVYTTSETSPGRISFGGADQDVTFERGRHVMEMPAAAPDTWKEIRIEAHGPGAEVCVSQTLVGTTTVPGS